MRYPIRLNRAVGPLLAVFGGTQGRSYVEVRERAVRFRFGWAFDQVFPRSEIIGVRPRRWPWLGGIGWRAWGSTLGLIGDSQNVVEVQLRTPRWTWLVLIPWRYTRIAVSLQDPEGFIQTMNGE